MFISNMGHVMTLANSIIGVGILAMPFCFYKCGIILSIILLVLNYLVTRISCYYLIKSALLARRRSFEFLGFYAFGASGKLMVELCIIGYLIGTCIAYFVVVGDLGPRIIAKILDLDESDNLRTWVMVIVTILCIIPLGLLRNVDSLSAVSTASIGFYFCLVMKVISESQAHLMANDWYDKIVLWEPDGVLQCLPIFSMACSCQMQLFEVMETVPNHTLEKMNSIVKQSTKICTSVYVMVGLFGYIGFCSIPFTGNILIHFSPTMSSEVIKMGFVLSVAFSFPLVIFPCRVSIYSLVYKRGHGDASTYIPEKRFKVITISIVITALLVALMIPSIELVIGLVGSTIGVAICVMFPASVYLKMFTKIRTTEKTLAQTVLIGGFCLMILGTYANLNAIDERRSGVVDVTQASQSKQMNEFRLSDALQKEIESKLMLSKSPINNILPSLEPYKGKNNQNANSNVIIHKLPQENAKHPVGDIPKAPVQDAPKLPVEDPPKLPVEDLPKLPVENVKLPTEIVKPIEKEIVINPKVEEEKSVIIERKDEDVKEQTKLNTDTKPKLDENIPKPANVTTSNNIIDKDAIKKDEEIAAEEAKESDTKLEIAEAELKKTKEMLEKKVDELKQEIVKQNEETQKLVNEKLTDIFEKVKEIKEEVEEEKKIEQEKVSENQKIASQKKEEEETNKLPEVDANIKFDAAKGSLVAQLSQKIQAQKLSKPDTNTITKTDNLTDKASSIIKTEPEIKIVPIESNIQEDLNAKENAAEPVKEKVYEPLSYKTGEMINKINESRPNIEENRAALPLPLLINSTSINKLANANSQLPSKAAEDTANIPNAETNKITSTATNTSDSAQKSNKLTESNIEAIRRDILEVREKKNDTPIREKRDLRDFEYNLAAVDKNENCLPNCYDTEPLKNANLVMDELQSGLKMMTGGRDLKSISEEDNADD